MTETNSIHTDIGHAEIDRVFYEILPKHGRSVREGQVGLCHRIYDALCGKRIALANADVGIGKTDAYIIAMALHRKLHPALDEVSSPMTPCDRNAFIMLDSIIAARESEGR